jgi:hypothetical protein
MANGILNFSTTGIPTYGMIKIVIIQKKMTRTIGKKKLVKCAAIISRWNISILSVSQF